MINISHRVSKIFFNHGLFCASHPFSIITAVIITVFFFCYPLFHLSVSRDVPFKAVSLTESQYSALKLTGDNPQTKDNDKITYVLQIIFRSTITPWQFDLNPVYGLRTSIKQSFLLNQIIKNVTVTDKWNENNSRGCQNNRCTSKGIDTFCLKMYKFLEDVNEQSTEEEKSVTSHGSSRILSSHNPSLPFKTCTILSPSLIWNESHQLFMKDDFELSERLDFIKGQGLMETLFGLPLRYIGMPNTRLKNSPSLNAFATTIVFNDFHTDYVDMLRDELMVNFPDSKYISREKSKLNFKTEVSLDQSHLSKPERRVFMVHYRGQNYLIDYAPLIIIYAVLLLYIYFSVRKIDMVRSKFGLAFSACVTVIASLFISMSLCGAVGLMSPALKTTEFFPYLVVLIGFENIIIITKAVVSTPVDLPVKYRVAHGMSKEGWPITKNLLTEFAFITLGFLTFDPAIQEFCLIAVIGLTTDFFLHTFFFVTVLSIDIRRMELDDLHSGLETSYINKESTGTNETTTSLDTSYRQYELGNFDPIQLNHDAGGVWSSDRTMPSVMKSFQTNSRRPSDIQTAAYLSSNGRANVRVPLRLRFLLHWAKLRVIQRIGMVVLGIWIAIIASYTLFFHDPDLSSEEVRYSNFLSIETNPLSYSITNNFTSNARLMNALIKDSPSDSPSDPLTPVEEDLFKMTTGSHNGISLSWHMDTMWRLMAFSGWPTIARHYNLSLLDHRIVILEPIYLSAMIPIEEAKQFAPLMSSNLEKNGIFDGDNANYKYDDPANDKVFYERIWQYIISFGPKDAWEVLSHPLYGLLNWTNLLWKTGVLFLTSLLGGFFFLTLTCVGMLLVHRSVSSSKPNAYKEPVVRVIPLTIQLAQTHSINDLIPSSSINIRNDWILACGNVHSQFLPNINQLQNNNFETQQSVVAATFCGLTETSNNLEKHVNNTQSKSIDESQIIRFWSIDCGRLMGTLYRNNFLSPNSELSVVWSMKILPSFQLVAGCSNGIIEIWDLRRSKLIQVLIPRMTENCVTRKYSMVTICSEDKNLQFISSSVDCPQNKLLAGITIIETVSCNCFLFGTDRGCVGLVSRTDSLSKHQLPLWSIKTIWLAHSRTVTHVSIQELTQPVASEEKISADNNENVEFLIVSGSEDGSIAVIQSLKPYFQTHSWDSSPVLCIDISCNTISFGQASGRIHIIKTVSTNNQNGKSSVEQGIREPRAVNGSKPENDVDLLYFKHYDLNPPNIRQSRSFLQVAEGFADIANPLINTSENAIIWIKLFTHGRTSFMSLRQKETFSSSGKHLSLMFLRLVSCSIDGMISIWRVGGQTNILRRFKSNPATFALPTPIICLGDRLIFGDQGYLRLVNPWTAKYERSVQLLPPSDDRVSGKHIISPTSSVFHGRWASGLGPLGVANGNKQHYVISLADAGQTLVIVPKSAFFN